MNQKVRIFIAVLILAVILMAGCQSQSILDSIFPESEALLSPTSTSIIIEQDEEEAVEPEPTATISSNVQLTIWVPPQFSPYSETEAAELLSDQFKSFMVENPRVNLDIRIKSTSGTSNMLDTLTYASQVASDALPSLVLLPRASLITAAEKGLVQPIEGVSTAIDEDDWYKFAQEMSIVGGTAYGLPFSADALALVYRDASLTSSQPNWDELLVQLDSLIFPANDTTLMTTLALYLSAGGSVQDPQGQAFIDVGALTLTLDAYTQGLNAGLLSSTLLELASDEQAWESFQTVESGGMITWASRQLQNSEELKLALLPTLGESTSTLAKGWIWCLVEQDADKAQIASLLVEHMVDPNFLASWTSISGYLPVRPSSTLAWQNPVTQDTISNMMLTAQLRPSISQDSAFNTSIITAVKEVLLDQSTPADAAQKAVESLEVVE